MRTTGRIAADAIITDTRGAVGVIRAPTSLRAKSIVATDFARSAARFGARCLALTVATHSIAKAFAGLCTRGSIATDTIIADTPIGAVGIICTPTCLGA